MMTDEMEISHNPPKPTQKIKLNVGGVYFVTHRDTLLAFDESYFGGLLRRGRPPEDDGAYFIDRDPTHFPKILNYMRTGRLEEVWGSDRLGFQQELNYYAMPTSLLQRYSHIFYDWLPKVKDITVEWDSNVTSKAPPLAKCLKNMLTCQTIVIAETNEGEVFGGFAEGWTCQQTCLPKRSWLFLLASPKKLPPMRFFLHVKSNDTFAGDSEAAETPETAEDDSSEDYEEEESEGEVIHPIHKTKRKPSIVFGCECPSQYDEDIYSSLEFVAEKDFVQCKLKNRHEEDSDNVESYLGDQKRSLDQICNVHGAHVRLQVWKVHL